MKVAIAGSGALGSGFGYHFQKAGSTVTLLDYWEDHIRAVNENGLKITVNGQEDTLKMSMVKPNEAQEIMDVIFIFTKATGLESMMQSIRHLIGADTRVVCLLNGLGHLKTLIKYVDEKNIVIGTTVWTAGIDAPGVTHFVGQGPVEVKNIVPEGKEATLEVVDLLNQAKLNGVYSENVMFTIWRKACLNGTSNALSALLDANVAEVFSSPTVDRMLVPIVSEFSQAAKLEDDVVIEVDKTVQYVKDINAKVGSHYPSMHQDIANRRPTEIDFLNGAVAEILHKHGHDAPYCRVITELIHAKEDVLGITKI